MRRLISSSTVVIAMLLLSQADVTAQQARDQRADQVCSWPEGVQADQNALVTAARLYQREASFRGDDDPQTVKCLTMAAQLLNHAMCYGDARRVMEAAADTALAQGDVGVAARTYLLAAQAARLDGKTADASRLAHRAEMLAGSPLLATAERDAIMARIPRKSVISLH